MADFTSSAEAGGNPTDSNRFETSRTRGNPLKTITNLSGAAISLALIAGVGVWGYKLLVRDVSGIPIVRAMQGEMRERPDDPGGQLAQHQGLSVNTVAAHGAAADPVDALRLAPAPVDLEDEDQSAKVLRVAARQQVNGPTALDQIAEPEVIDVAAALQSGDVDALVAQITNGVAPMSAQNDMPIETTSETDTPAKPVLDAPGVRYSWRPRLRPAVSARVVQVAAVANVPDISAEKLPAGTYLAQLGAFDSAEVAKAQWDQAHQRFGAYLEGKSRVIQKATSGGRVFYRLRAMGFQDLADARRFCSALVAENADCIPVVSR